MERQYYRACKYGASSIPETSHSMYLFFLALCPRQRMHTMANSVVFVAFALVYC
jgi:hypothetical protein